MIVPIEKEIETLKKKRNAVILAHNYQLPEVQDIADFVGDSLELSWLAAKTDAEVIVFCGVYFMAETAVILSPEKTVLLPNMNAGCPMADMINADQLRQLKGKYPNAVVICYVNSSAEVKAQSDYCCTSSNGLRVVESLKDDQEIIFVPDRHLGDYIGALERLLPDPRSHRRRRYRTDKKRTPQSNCNGSPGMHQADMRYG